MNRLSIIAIVFAIGCIENESEWPELYERFYRKAADSQPCEKIGELDICLISNGIQYDPEWFIRKMDDMADCAGMDVDDIDDFILKLHDGFLEEHETWYVSGEQNGMYIELSMYPDRPEESFAHEVGHVIEYRKYIYNKHDDFGLAVYCGDAIDIAWEFGVQDEYEPPGDGLELAEKWNEMNNSEGE